MGKKTETAVVVAAGKMTALTMTAKQLQEEFTAFARLENEAAWRALRIGMLLLRAKEECAHGEFGDWMAQHVGEVRERQARNFMELARAYVERRKLEKADAFMLTAGDDGAKTRAEQAAALEFVGQKSLNELLREHNIKAPPPPAGGDQNLVAWLKEQRPELVGKVKSRKELDKADRALLEAWCEARMEAVKQRSLPGHQKLMARTAWENIGAQLVEHGLKRRTWGYLERPQLELVHGLLGDVRKEMQAALKG